MTCLLVRARLLLTGVVAAFEDMLLGLCFTAAGSKYWENTMI
jgi:hypothetical protein